MEQIKQRKKDLSTPPDPDKGSKNEEYDQKFSGSWPPKVQCLTNMMVLNRCIRIEGFLITHQFIIMHRLTTALNIVNFPFFSVEPE